MKNSWREPLIVNRLLIRTILVVRDKDYSTGMLVHQDKDYSTGMLVHQDKDF